MSKVKVLFFSADPSGKLRLAEDIRRTREKVRMAEHRDALWFDWRPAARPDDLIQALNEMPPHVVHFSGHGESRGLVLEGSDGSPRLVDAKALAQLFRAFPGGIRLAVLNACFSLPQAEAIAKEVGCAIGTRNAISDEAAITFGASLYRAIAFGRSVREAFDQASAAVALEHPDDAECPVLVARPDVDPAQLVLVRPDVGEQRNGEVTSGRNVVLSTPAPPFIGYLRDRLVAEKGLYDLSRITELASFPLIGYRATAAAMEFVAFRPADRLTESQIVSLRNEFFDAVQHVAREFGLKPRGRNPNGLLAFVFEEGCSAAAAGFIRKQTKISHRAGTGAVTVSWAVDLKHRRVHTHENPVSLFPPVIVMAQTVFPGLAWLESVLAALPDGASRSTAEDPGHPGPATPPPPPAPPQAADRVRILFVGANSARAPLDLEREVSRIEQDIRMARERDAVSFRPVGAVTCDTLMQEMLDEPPTIVHFAGHGSTRGILLRDEAGEPHLVTGDALASLFALFRDTVRCVVLNACWSEAQAKAIRQHVPHVIGTRAEIPDLAAHAFSAGFYKAIAAGKDVPFAFEAGKARVQMQGCGGEDVLVLL